MESLVKQTISLQTEDSFFESLQKIVFNSRNNFDHFKSAVSIIKAIFKSEIHDSEPKYKALIILKEISCHDMRNEVIYLTYFSDKIAKRMKDFAIHASKQPEDVRGITCFEKFRKNSNGDFAHKFYRLNLGKRD